MQNLSFYLHSSKHWLILSVVYYSKNKQKVLNRFLDFFTRHFAIMKKLPCHLNLTTLNFLKSIYKNVSLKLSPSIS